jgi:hypothetical protein
VIFLGFLLILASAGVSLALIWGNDSIFTAPAPVVDLFGYQVHPTVGGVFLAGAVAGAAAVLGLVMLLKGIGRSADRRSTARHQLRSRRDEIREQQREHDAADRADRHAAAGEAVDSEEITTGR